MSDKDGHPARDKELVSALADEVSSLRDSAEKLLFSFDRVFPFAVVLVVGGLTVGISGGHRLVLAFIPFPLAIFYAYLLGLNIEGLSRAGHKRYLEERLNQLLQTNAFVEESFVAPTRQGRWRAGRLSVIATQLGVALVLIALSVVGAVTCYQHRVLYFVVYLVTLTIPIVANVAAVFELQGAYKSAYLAAQHSSLGTSGRAPQLN